MKNEHEIDKSNQEQYFFETFPLIDKIAVKKLKLSELVDSEDIAQEVKFSLLIWKSNCSDKYLTQEEWQKFVNRVRHNKIKAFHRNQIKNIVSLTEADENEICLLAKTNPPITKFEGNTIMELHLLSTQMWEVIKKQSFFEKNILT